MGLADGATMIFLTGRYVDSSGAPVAGTVTVQPETVGPVIAATGDVIMANTPRAVSLDSGGFFRTLVAASDDPNLNPVGFTYRITDPFGRTFSIRVPRASPGGVLDLITVMPASATDPGVVQLAAGRGIAHTVVNTSGHLMITYDDGVQEDAGTVVTGGIDLSSYETRAQSASDIAAATANLVSTGDSRLTNPRTPTAHAATHGTAGSDPLAPSAIGAAQGFATIASAAAYTATGGDFVKADATTSWTLTLPTAPADKTRIGGKVIALGAGQALTVACGGSDRFNTASGATSITLSLLNQGQIWQYDAGAHVWIVQCDNLPLSALNSLYASATDPRLTDARTPILHAATHAAGGSDALRLDQLAAPTGPVNVGGQRVTAAGDPVGNTDLATRGWVIANTGTGSGGTGTGSILGASDYDNTTAPTDGQAILWNNTATKWHPGQVILPGDSRLTDARAPLAHAATHGSGGSDPIAPASIGAAPTSHTHAGGDISSGTVGYARLPVGTVASTVAAGDDTRITGAQQTGQKGSANGYPSLDGSSKIPVAQLPTSASGVSSATLVPLANDSRLSDARTPTAHVHSGADVTSGTVAYARLPIGTGASTVAAGDDNRFTNARTPLAHAATHASGGSDPVTPSAIGAASATHAAQHATGGSDPVTPSAIGAAAATETSALRSTVYGSASASAPPICVVVNTADFTAANNTNVYAQGGWSVASANGGYDPLGMATLSTTVGVFSYVTIPVAGRYRTHLHCSWSTTGAGALYNRVMLGAADYTKTIAHGVQTPFGTGGTSEVPVDAISEHHVFAAGDKIYWGNFANTSGTNTVRALQYGMPSFLEVRYIGPA